MQDVLAGCIEVSSLSPLSGQILKRLSPRPLLKTRSLSSCVRDTSPEISEDLAVGASFSQTSPRQISSPTSPPPVSIHAEEDEQVMSSLFKLDFVHLHSLIRQTLILSEETVT